MENKDLYITQLEEVDQEHLLIRNKSYSNAGSAGGAGSDVTPIFGPGLPNSGVYAGGGGGGTKMMVRVDQVEQVVVEHLEIFQQELE
jgi:hypothetical protein